MNINMTIIRISVQRSLQESQKQGITNELRSKQAIFHALKAMCVLCKDQPLPVPVEVVGTPEGSNLASVAAIMAQPEFVEVSRLLPGIVQEEMAHESKYEKEQN